MKTKQGLERLQAAVNLANNTRLDRRLNEDGFTLSDLQAEHWLKLYDAYVASGWDITPDAWSIEQINSALMGMFCPDFDNKTEKPKGSKPYDWSLHRLHC